MQPSDWLHSRCCITLDLQSCAPQCTYLWHLTKIWYHNLLNNSHHIQLCNDSYAGYCWIPHIHNTLVPANWELLMGWSTSTKVIVCKTSWVLYLVRGSCWVEFKLCVNSVVITGRVIMCRVQNISWPMAFSIQFSDEHPNSIYVQSTMHPVQNKNPDLAANCLANRPRVVTEYWCLNQVHPHVHQVWWRECTTQTWLTHSTGGVATL